MSEFKLGDVVMLRSGSPHMTIRDISDQGVVVMEWFNEHEFTFEVTHRRIEVLNTTYDLIERKETV